MEVIIPTLPSGTASGSDYGDGDDNHNSNANTIHILITAPSAIMTTAHLL